LLCYKQYRKKNDLSCHQQQNTAFTKNHQKISCRALRYTYHMCCLTLLLLQALKETEGRRQRLDRERYTLSQQMLGWKAGVCNMASSSSSTGIPPASLTAAAAADDDAAAQAAAAVPKAEAEPLPQQFSFDDHHPDQGRASAS
jgi:hypothetical protein